MSEFKRKYGPWALVAGASQGLGEAFAEALARRGMHLILVARRADKLNQVAQRLHDDYGILTKTVNIDLGDFQLLKKALTQIEDPIGLLLYNAAYSPIGAFEQISEKDLEQIVNVNIRTPLLLTKFLSDGMIERQKGGIVLMSSLAGLQGSPKIATYAASKAFNSILAEGLWKELMKNNIHVLTTCAGAISTPGYETAKGNKTAPGTLTASQIAESTLKSLGRGPTVIPGLTNKLAVFVMRRLLPARWRIAIMNNNTKDLT
jgi:hypothetical protein